MTDKVEELRNELRRKRIERPLADSGSNDWDTRSPDTTAGPGYQTVRREGGAVDNAYRQAAGDSRVMGEGVIGSGQGDRRPGSDNSGVYDGTATAPRRGRRARGRIEADDDVPIRTASNVLAEDYVPSAKKRGRKPRSSIPVVNIEPEPVKKRNYFRIKTLPFTYEEALLKTEPLRAALGDIFTYTDEYLWWAAEDELRQPIWSDVDEEEMQKLVSTLIGQAQQSGAGAAVVNNIILASNYIAIGGITIPRLARTLKLLGTAQVKSKQKRQLQVVK